MARSLFTRWLSSWLSVRPTVAARRKPHSRSNIYLELLEDRTSPATFTVINTLSTGAGSLRAAITSSNATAGPNTINFNIPTSDPNFNAGTGAFTITPATPLPQIITNAVTIDGLSEKTFISSTKAYPIVALNGGLLGVGSTGLDLNVNSSTIKGLNFNTWGGTGIHVQPGVTGASILGNFIGTNVTGTASAACDIGIDMDGTGTIGGTAAASRNVISGNTTAGIDVNGAGVKVQGNFIGTDLNGTAAIGNGTGVEVESGTATIGGSSTAKNVISGNTGAGILVTGFFASNALITNNFIGIKNNLTGPLANDVGVQVTSSASFNTIGGAASTFKNVISGNTSAGILISNGASSNFVQGNFVGTNALGTAAFANGVGIRLSDDGGSNTIGNVVAGFGNLISGNTNAGVLVEAINTFSAGSGDMLLGNSIGINAAGTAALANGTGVAVTRAVGGFGSVSGVTIGGAGAARNIISGNNGDGVAISTSGVSNVVVQNNFIGINTAGTGKVANTGSGVSIVDASSNTIGGAVAGLGNVISGNTGAGVLVKGQSGSTSFNSIQGNLIGTTAAGSAILNNSGNGITAALDPAGFGSISNLTIGGTTAATRNVISGNTGDGIAVAGGSISSVAVTGNFIGTSSTGTVDLGNAGNGISITDASSFSGSVRVGGTTAAERNVISGNTKSGVLVTGAASDVLVQGNFIGIDVNGTTALGNSITGMTVSGTASDVTIGGTIAGARNVISSNASDGVLITARTSFGAPAIVQGNIIGLNAAGAAKLANAGNGVQIINSSGSSIGGAVTGARNIISGNTKNGVLVSGRFATSNNISGNFIGTDITGNVDQGNTLNGIFLSNAGNNAIGGSFGTANGNVISGNDGQGVLILGLTANNNTLSGNLIGTNAAGTADLGNTGNGIFINGGANNTIDGGTSGFTVISGNNQHGIAIAGANASSNDIANALIGTNIDGLAAIGNSLSGVFISNAPGNTITGSVISGNVQHGVVIIGGFAATNSLSANYIGTDVTGTSDLGNALFGVYISNAPSNTIGSGGSFSSGKGNVISGNNKDGIYIAGPSATANSITANYIGTDLTGSVARGNTGNGITVMGPNTSVQGNLISANTQNGVAIAGTYGTGATLRGNYIGTDILGLADLGNAANGVLVSSAKNNTIGGTGFSQFSQSTSGGNVISGNNASGVLIVNSIATGNSVQSNYIGVNALGEAALPNATDGVRIDNAPGNSIGGGNNSIGGANASTGNVISGNTGNGINILGPAAIGNTVQFNTIGLNASGNAAVANTGNGVQTASPNTIIGGTFVSDSIPLAGLGNVISGNLQNGINILSGAAHTKVQANLIGTDQTGTVDLGNVVTGITVDGTTDVTIGGGNVLERNVVSGNNSHGILLKTAANAVVIAGNFIGTNVNGNAALGNAGHGVLILSGIANTVGGTGAGEGNTIANNGSAGSGAGISLGSGSKNGFLTNSIFANTTVAISESAGTNNGIVAPSLTSATRSAAGVTINGSISGANGTYRVEFFASAATGQAQRFLGFKDVTISSGGSATFSSDPFAVLVGEFLTSTVTDAINDTSILSNALTSP